MSRFQDEKMSISDLIPLYPSPEASNTRFRRLALLLGPNLAGESKNFPLRSTHPLNMIARPYIPLVGAEIFTIEKPASLVMVAVPSDPT